jgi:hypothetical protein
MRLTETLPLPWFVRRLGALLLAVASTAAAAQALPPFETGTAPLREITGAGGAFVRGAALQRFEIGHVTLQTVRRPFSQAC